jgi:hypothetical protein
VVVDDDDTETAISSAVVIRGPGIHLPLAVRRFAS